MRLTTILIVAILTACEPYSLDGGCDDIRAPDVCGWTVVRNSETGLLELRLVSDRPMQGTWAGVCWDAQEVRSVEQLDAETADRVCDTETLLTPRPQPSTP